MSFSEMMSSARGPGVIGMILGLMVLLGFGCLFMLAFDEGFQGGKSIGSVIARQREEIANYQEGITNGQQALDKSPALLKNSDELDRLQRGSKLRQDNITQLITRIANAKTDIANRLKVYENYKDDYRAYARGKAKGESIDKLETVTGAVYKNVTIREVTAVGIQIRHDDGQKRIPFEELPQAMKDRFQFDPSQKVKALADEAAARSVHEAAVAVADGLADQQAAKDRAKGVEENHQKVLQTIAIKEAEIVSLKQDIISLRQDMSRASSEASSARAAGHIHIDRTSNVGDSIQSKQNRIAAVQAEINQLKFQP